PVDPELVEQRHLSRTVHALAEHERLSRLMVGLPHAFEPGPHPADADRDRLLNTALAEGGSQIRLERLGDLLHLAWVRDRPDDLGTRAPRAPQHLRTEPRCGTVDTLLQHRPAPGANPAHA